jgi:hypothetical protein
VAGTEDPRLAFTNAAWKRPARTRRSKAGWGETHFERLLTGFGFLYRDGGEHRIYWDPGEKANRVGIPRHGELKAYVAEQALVAIDRMLARRGITP